MKTRNHILCKDEGKEYPFVPSPNCGGKLEPDYLIIHYTASPGFHQAVSWLVDPQARASAHLVIGREGEVTQLVPFNQVAWHAGVSAWRNLDGMNNHSIGIELDNAGRLQRQGDRWRAWFGRLYDGDYVVVATHRHEKEPAGWHAYTEKQIEILLEVATLLVSAYDLKDVLGHEDVAPVRKSDPGPAFPLKSVRDRILGRETVARDRYKTQTVLAIRSAPAPECPAVEGSPLPKGAEVEVVDGYGAWCLVEALVPLDRVTEVQGWVNGRYLRPVG